MEQESLAAVRLAPDVDARPSLLAEVIAAAHREHPAVETARQRRRRRTRGDLVAAALAIIADRGLSDATVDRLSAVSGISRGTIYAYFPDGRDALLRAAYAELGRALVARTRAAVGSAAGWRASIMAHAHEMFALAADPHLGHFYNVSGPALVANSSERGIGSSASVAMIRRVIDDAAFAQTSRPDGAPAAPETSPALALAVLLVGALREAAIAVAGGSLDREAATAGFARLVDGVALPRD